MPKMLLTFLGANDESGVVVRTHKNVGDAVSIGEPVADIETTKCVEEIISTVSGTVSHIAPVGVRIGLGDCLLEVNGENDGAPRAPLKNQSEISERLRRRMTDDAFALLQGCGRDVLAALPQEGLITTKLVASLSRGKVQALAPAIDLEKYLGARTNEKYCAHLTSNMLPGKPSLSENFLLLKIASRYSDFIALLLKPVPTESFSLSAVFDFKGIPGLAEIGHKALAHSSTIAERKLEIILDRRRSGVLRSAATRSVFAVSTLSGTYVSRHFPIVPERHAAIFGLLISAGACSLTLGYDHRWLSGINAAKMLDLAVALLIEPQ